MACQLFFLVRKWPVWSPRPSSLTSDEDGLAFCRCRAEDVSGGGFQDLVCYSFAEGVLSVAAGGIPNGEIPGDTFIW